MECGRDARPTIAEPGGGDAVGDGAQVGRRRRVRGSRAVGAARSRGHQRGDVAGLQALQHLPRRRLGRVESCLAGLVETHARGAVEHDRGGDSPLRRRPRPLVAQHRPGQRHRQQADRRAPDEQEEELAQPRALPLFRVRALEEHHRAPVDVAVARAAEQVEHQRHYRRPHANQQ